MQYSHKTVLLFIIISFSIHSEAQTVVLGNMEYKIKNPQPVRGKAFYDLVYVQDSSQPEHPYKEILELDFGKTKSMFFSYTKKLSDSLMTADVMKQVKNAPDPDHIELTMRGSLFVSNDMYYTDDSSSKVYSLKPIASALFYIKDTQPKINWKILDSTKTIKNYLCQKAVGESHGRTYTAWFCNDLPYNFGPRKLYGLPGLILEAYDTKREVVYKLNRVIIPSQGKVGLPDNAMSATDEQYNKNTEAFRKNPAAFSKGLQVASAGTPTKNPLNDLDPSKIKAISVIKETPYGKGVSLKTNNPIDLK